MPAVGDEILANDFGTPVENAQSTAGTTTSTSFTATLTGGTACEAVFVAPTSGRVLVLNQSRCANSTTETATCGYALGTGSTPGTNQTVAASTLRAARVTGTNAVMSGFADLVTGLTAGDTYWVRQMFATSGVSTSTFDIKSIIVIPLP